MHRHVRSCPRSSLPCSFTARPSAPTYVRSSARRGLLVLWLAIASLVLSGAAGAAQLTVGFDSNCDFRFLEKAIVAAVDGDTLLLSQGVYRESDDGNPTGGYKIVDKSLTLIGGHKYCGGARIGTSTLTTDLAERVLTISADDRQDVQLQFLEITGGTWDGIDQGSGGGLRIVGWVVAYLDDVVIENNEAYLGGGVGLVSVGFDRPTLWVTGSSISRNDADSDGGGVHCTPGSDIHVRDSRIGANVAGGRGGGVFAENCQVRLLWEGDSSVDGNLALSKGGGFSLTNGSRLQFQVGAAPSFNPRYLVAENQAINSGGGVSLEGGSLLEGEGVNFTHNISWWSGGAIAAESGSVVDIDGTEEDCRNPNGCRFFFDNVAGFLGGAVYADDADVKLVAVRGRNNHSGQGRGMFAFAGPGSSLDLWSAALDQHKGKNLIELDGADELDLRSSTIFDNDLSEAVIQNLGAQNRNVSQSIFHENGAPYRQGDVVQFKCNLFDDDFNLPQPWQGNRVGDPDFVAAGDYHLENDSPARAMCDVFTRWAAFDLEFRVRQFGQSYTAGAHELF